jgi:hypothetical protein
MTCMGATIVYTCIKKREEALSSLECHYLQTISYTKRTVEWHCSRLFLKFDGTCTENRFRLSVKQTSPFKLAGASVQSTTGNCGVGISSSNGSNPGYTKSRGSVKGTGYPLHSPVSPSLPLPLHHHVPSHFNWTLGHMKLSIKKKDWFTVCCFKMMTYSFWTFCLQ